MERVRRAVGKLGSATMPTSEEERTYLESLIREDFERCHPGETLEDLKRRASFSKEDRGLLRDWMAIAARRAAVIRHSEDRRCPPAEMKSSLNINGD
jgi:hypothetical protein